MGKSLAVCLTLAWLASGCNHRRDLEIMLVPTLPKPEPYVKQGDVIRWYNSDGSPMSVTFSLSGGSPCTETNQTTNVCHVKAAGGIFNYSCKGCKDPVVPVGKNQGTYGLVKTDEPDGYVDPVGVACDANNNAVVDPQTARRGDQFQWFATGAKPVPAWSFVLKGVCTEADSTGNFDQTKRICTVSQNAASGTQTYTVTVPACTGNPTYAVQISIQ